MKRAVSILLILLALGSAARITIDRHFCGGKAVDVRLAIDDKRADCGMQKEGAVCTHVVSVKDNCCRNELTTFSVNDFLIAGSLSVQNPLFSFLDTFSALPEFTCLSLYKQTAPLNGAGPPGLFSLMPDQQSRLCVFRI